MTDFFEWIVSPKIILSGVLILIAAVLYLILNKLGKKYKKKQNEKEKALLLALDVVRVLLVLCAVMVILQINDINITSLIAGLGIVSAIVGLALQDLLKDVIMGIHIKAERFFNVGECVEYEGRECTVIGFTLISTKLGDLDDHSVFTVCNRNISEIRRFGERMDIDIPLSYNEDVKTVHNMMRFAAESIESIDGVSKCEYKGTQAFESSDILYRLRIFCVPEKRADVRRDALMTMQDTLAKYDIHIPFNQLDVHIDKM